MYLKKLKKIPGNDNAVNLIFFFIYHIFPWSAGYLKNVKTLTLIYTHMKGREGNDNVQQSSDTVLTYVVSLNLPINIMIIELSYHFKVEQRLTITCLPKIT